MKDTFRDPFQHLALPDGFVIDATWTTDPGFTIDATNGGAPLHTLDAAAPAAAPAAATAPSPAPMPRRLRTHRTGRFGIPAGAGRRLARRSQVAAVPLVLGLALSVFALVRMQSANTLWYQELQLSSSVGTGSFACQPYVIALKSAPVEAGGKTTYTYTFSGGGIAGPTCAKNIDYIALPVCFDPALNAVVQSETHPAPGTNPVSSWAYAPDTAGKLVKWKATNAGHGPFNALEFSITLTGTGIPTENVTAKYMEVSGSGPLGAGTVAVPKPASCAAPLRTTLGARPPASTSNPIVTVDASPSNDEEAAKSIDAEPTATPRPTSTPTATPTPKVVNKPGESIGILKFPSTPNPGGGGR
ncbi:MAG: hypothetical protein LC118_04690 [Dehalococcoidia bacterium]|nr:hypothetical protein [Dehalococcoidia bacterium]